MSKEKRKRRSTETSVLPVEVTEETAYIFAQWVRALQKEHFYLPRIFPRDNQVTEFGQEYLKKYTPQGMSYLLKYRTVLKALKLAETSHTQLDLLDETFGEELELSIFTYKDRPDDQEVFIKSMTLLLFLERLMKEPEIEVATYQRLTELVQALSYHLSTEKIVEFTLAQSRTDLPVSQD